MNKNPFKQRLLRREQLLGLLRSDDHWISAELSQQLGISHRTLMRDLAELRQEGYPIEADRGRGGGIRLRGRWGIERLSLDYREVIEMILALTVVENLQSPLFSTHLKSIRQKISSVFPDAQRKTINTIRKRIMLGDAASSQIMAGYSTPANAIATAVSECFFESRHITLHYQSEKGEITKRRIEPHYILVNWPVWYILAWDHLRQDIRFFRLDRIQQCTQHEKTFKLKRQQDFLRLYEPYFQPL